MIMLSCKTFCLLMTTRSIHFRYHSKIFLSLLQIFMNNNTRNATQKYLSLPLANTNKYGINSIKYQSISAWNMFVNKFHNLDLQWPPVEII